MQNFFEILKGVFFALTLAWALFLVRGAFFLEDAVFERIKDLLTPGYLLFCGLMLSRVLHRLKNDGSSVAFGARTFVVGIVVGVVLALSYIFL